MSTSENSRSGSAPRIVVVGAGYAGVMAANRILSAASVAGRPKPQVTVINPRSDFVERIRLHQLVAGSGEALLPLASVLHSEAHVHIGSVDRVDATTRTLLLADGSQMSYNYLVYAVGSRARSGIVPGVAEHALTLAEYESAMKLRARLTDLDEGARVTVVGGGATGIETAAELAERRPGLHVTLVSSGPVAGTTSTAAQRAITRRLAKLGVELVSNVRVVAVSKAKIELSDHTSRPSDLTIWTGAFEVPDLARRSDLPTDSAGRLRTDAALVCIDHPEIVGVGDAAAPPAELAGHIRMSCQGALPLGAHGADTILALIAGQTPKPVSIGFVMQCFSLGRAVGVAQLTHQDDTPRPLVLSGYAGRAVKEWICGKTVDWMREVANGGSYSWPGGPR